MSENNSVDNAVDNTTDNTEFIELQNENGETFRMSREEFRTTVLPQTMEALWDDMENLRMFAMELLKDKFTEEVAKAADRLLELYGPIEPARIFRSVVHMQAGELTEAKAMLHDIIEQYPESAVAHINLARIYAFQNEEQKASELLEKGVSLDPNEENGLDWMVQAHVQTNNVDQLFRQFTEIAERDERAWRPQYIMASIALGSKDLLTAMKWFEAALDRVEGHEELVMNVTGELGQAGYPYQLIQISEKYWKPTFVVPYAGMNYVQALLQTDQPQKGIEVLKQLHENVNPDFKPLVEDFMSKIPPEVFQAMEAPEQTADASDNKDDKKPWWKVW